MSIEVVSLALKAKLEKSSTKFVLVVMANCADTQTMLAFPSTEYIVQATGQDRKTVLANVARLRDLGFIEDTGNRCGSTRQIPIYLLKKETIEQSQNWDYSKSKKTPSNSPETGTVKQSQKRNSTENGTVPKTDGNGPVFPSKRSRFSAKRSQKRHPEKSEPKAIPSKKGQIADGCKHQPAGKEKTPEQESARETWFSYSEAYRNRYGADPVRNASVNAIISQFVRRVPLAEAPSIAAFYVQSRNGYYAGKGHTVKPMLQDAEKLRTEWLTGRQITQESARQQDKSASNPFLKIREERIANET